jgi:hypothetical protein
MNTTSNALASVKSERQTVFPLVSGKLKSGAFVPKDNMVEAVIAILGLLYLRALVQCQLLTICPGAVVVRHFLATA